MLANFRVTEGIIIKDAAFSNLGFKLLLIQRYKCALRKRSVEIAYYIGLCKRCQNFN